MIVFDHLDEEDYRKRDPIRGLLEKQCVGEDGSFASHGWLTASLTQRMIYHHMYGDLLSPDSKRKRVLDVGGGFCSLTRLMVENHDYTLLDIMAHDGHAKFKETERTLDRPFWLSQDWHGYVPDAEYDIVVANDLLPNVDQRLELFISKFVETAREIRILLTYYNSPRVYQAKRLDASEILWVLAWDGRQVRTVLEKHLSRIEQPNLDALSEPLPSLFSNDRQVCMVKLRGDLA